MYQLHNGSLPSHGACLESKRGCLLIGVILNSEKFKKKKDESEELNELDKLSKPIIQNTIL